MRKSESKSAAKQHQLNTFSGLPDVDTEQRWQMISEAAYFVAEQRGFDGGDPVQDWLAAESQIDSVYFSRTPVNDKEATAYAQLRDEIGKALSQVKDVMDASAVKSAFERGVDEVRRMEHYSSDILRKATASVQEDMAHAAERMGPAWEHFSEESADLFSVWKDRSHSFLSRSASSVREWLRHERRGAGH